MKDTIILGERKESEIARNSIEKTVSLFDFAHSSIWVNGLWDKVIFNYSSHN